MLAMLFVATALLKIDLVRSEPIRPTTQQINCTTTIKRSHNGDVTPEVTEKLRVSVPDKKNEHIKKQSKSSEKEEKEEAKKNIFESEVDVVDRADHITQYIADMFVNTDDEITSLQAMEPEEAMYGINEKDSFSEFLASRDMSGGLDRLEPDLSR